MTRPASLCGLAGCPRPTTELRVDMERAQAVLEAARARLKEQYELTYPEFGDKLYDEQLQQLLAGQLDKVYDDVSEAFLESSWAEENRIIEELVPDEEERELLDYADLLDELRFAIRERDTSDPVGALLRQTGDKVFRYRLGFTFDDESWAEAGANSEAMARRIAAAAGIDFKKNERALRDLVACSFNGGELFVLFGHSPQEILRTGDNPEQITWTDPVLLLLDRVFGSGHEERVTGVVQRPFDLQQVFLETRARSGSSWTDVVGRLNARDYRGEVTFNAAGK